MMALTDYMRLSLYGWEFDCDHPGCNVKAGYDERYFPAAERHLRRDGWESYDNGTHACPHHVADYTGYEEETPA